jgi:LPS sulfotransferase NodH
MSEFRIPPVSTLIGSSPLNFFRVMQGGGKVSSEYYGKLLLTSMIVGLTYPFHAIDKFTWDRRAAQSGLKKPPLFILGHWRSGTTFLHNLLCQDPRAGYVTTFQSLFPQEMASQWLFKPLMKATMPDKRPSDSVKLDVDLPQEDEFAIGNLTTESFYHFFYFPQLYRDYRELSIDKINRGESTSWDKLYNLMLVKASLNTGADRLVVKNPVNTARIPALLRIYPDAKFLFIHRNPVSTVLSTIRFFKAVMPALWFHQVSDDFIQEMVYDNFNYMMQQYEETKRLIPEVNLMETGYEDFEKHPVEHAEKVYQILLQEDIKPFRSKLNDFISSQKKHRVNSYRIDREQLNSMTQRLTFWMEKGGYGVPEEIIIKDETNLDQV